MLATIILCLGSFREGYQQADVEVVELNHVVHEVTGENQFTQVILWVGSTTFRIRDSL